MALRYAPLVIPAPQCIFPVDYQSKIITFDGTRTYTAQQHTKKMTDYFELHEIDIGDVQMRIFVQILAREVKTWFISLSPKSIDSLEVLYQQFLNSWEEKKNPLQILFEYENLKRGPNETIQDYYTWFNNVYNVIPLDLRPPGLALIKFPDGFYIDMDFQLRERNPPTLEDMQSVVVSVEANLLSKRARVRNERRTPLKDAS